MITDQDPVHYKTRYKERNKADNLCADGRSHGPPEPGSQRCAACNHKNRTRMMIKNGTRPWSESKVGRPPVHLMKQPVSVESKVAKLKSRLEKHIFWVDTISAQIGKLEGKTKKPILQRFKLFMESEVAGLEH